MCLMILVCDKLMCFGAKRLLVNSTMNVLAYMYKTLMIFMDSWKDPGRDILNTTGTCSKSHAVEGGQGALGYNLWNARTPFSDRLSLDLMSVSLSACQCPCEVS